MHNEVKFVLLIFLLAFTINLISDAAKICLKIDTGCKRRIVNSLKVTHILTLGALVYGTIVRFSRAGQVCSCTKYPLPSDKQERDDLILNTCFGKYTNLYEYLLYILYGLFTVLGIGITLFFCTDACKRMKERAAEEDAMNATEGNEPRQGRKSTSI